VPVGSTKNPVPESHRADRKREFLLPLSGALEDRLTSCAIELDGMSSARNKPIGLRNVSAKIPKKLANECRKDNSGRATKN